MNFAQFTGIGAFGRAYRIMLDNDAHAVGSVDRELFRTMVRLCPETADYLYSSFTPTVIPHRGENRPELESILNSICADRGEPETLIQAIVNFTQGLGTDVEPDLNRMVVGGTEEQIIRRGSDWCTDVARVACVLCQIAGFPARIVYLFNLDQAYSGHAIIETFYEGKWGALDSSTGLIYKTRNGQPASTWELMNDPSLIETHHRDSRVLYTTVEQFQAAGIANYLCWQVDRYNYSTSHLNAYYLSILQMSNKGWPGGLRWLHGEDTEDAEPNVATNSAFHREIDELKQLKMARESLIKATPDNYRKLRHRSDVWSPVIEVICQRHRIPVERLSQFPDGSNIIFAVGPHYVIKLFCEADQFERERLLLSRLGCSLGVEIPQIEADGDIENWPYLVMTRLPGQRLDSCWERLDSAEKTAIVEDLGRIIARLHQFPTQAMEGLEQLPELTPERIREIVSEEWENGIPEHLLMQIPPLFESVQPLFLPETPRGATKSKTEQF